MPPEEGISSTPDCWTRRIRYSLPGVASLMRCRPRTPRRLRHTLIRQTQPPLDGNLGQRKRWPRHGCWADRESLRTDCDDREHLSPPHAQRAHRPTLHYTSDSTNQPRIRHSELSNDRPRAHHGERAHNQPRTRHSERAHDQPRTRHSERAHAALTAEQIRQARRAVSGRSPRRHLIRLGYTTYATNQKVADGRANKRAEPRCKQPQAACNTHTSGRRRSPRARRRVPSEPTTQHRHNSARARRQADGRDILTTTTAYWTAAAA